MNRGNVMTEQPDALAAERFRHIVAEAIDKPGMDAPWDEAQPVLDRFPEARFERHVNEHGVAMRRVVAASEWEVDPEPAPVAPPGCVCDPTSPAPLHNQLCQFA